MNSKYSPWEQLPAKEPRYAKYPMGHFYKQTARHLVIDTVRIMDNGLSIDIDKVAELEDILVTQIAEVDAELAANPIIQEYVKKRFASKVEAYVKDRKSKLRSPDYYMTEFKHTDMLHRSYFMDEYAKSQGWSTPKEKLPTGVGKWPKTLAAKYAKSNKVVDFLLKGELPSGNPTVLIAMSRLAQDKADMYNEKYLEQVKDPKVEYPKFNPGSPKQVGEVFASLGIESEAFSKDTGEPSWSRDQVERVHKETNDKNVKDLTQSLIDFSFAAIVKNNFIAAFYTYTVNGRLHGQYKLLGAKSARYTSSNPNMLNTPSTKSRFAKPVKRCFVAPEGKIIIAADYSALEDRVIASLTRDKNKCAIFLKNLDGHSLNALGYFVDEVGKLFTLSGDPAVDAKKLKELVDLGDAIADEIRQRSKAPTFKLAYGGYPDAHKGGVITQAIFDNYHNVLYPDITNYRENYVLPAAEESGEIHLGLGFFIKTDNPSKDIRTLTNATCQFWSILTALTINRMHQLIDENVYQDDVKIISTIYDSIYLEVTCTPEIIQWTNNNLIDTMLVDFMEDQTVKNEANSDIGYNWADMITLSNNAPLSEIEEALEALKEKGK